MITPQQRQVFKSLRKAVMDVEQEIFDIETEAVLDHQQLNTLQIVNLIETFRDSFNQILDEHINTVRELEEVVPGVDETETAAL